MKVAMYARVSTSDKHQDPETQLMPLREFVQAQGWETVREYVDHASAADMVRRSAWRELLDDASKKKFDLLLVWRMDRAFRSVLDGATTLERFRGWKVGLRSYNESWIDTTSPLGEAMYHITIVWSQLERSILIERVRAGMDRAKRQGKAIGRPGTASYYYCERCIRACPPLHFELKGHKRGKAVMEVLETLLPLWESGDLSLRKLAKQLGLSRRTVGRLVKARETDDMVHG